MVRTGGSSISYRTCCVVGILLASMCWSSVVGVLVTAPTNRVAMLGATIQFKCSTDQKYSINWQHISFRPGSVPVDVYISRVVVSPYYGRFSVETKDLGGNVTEYNLIISNVQKEDAGTYICIDYSGLGEKKMAQLTVIDSPPRCSSNIDPIGIIGENDCGQAIEEIRASCSLEYTGDIAPASQWVTSTGGLLSTASIMNITEHSVSSDLSVDASISMNGISISWQLVEFPHIKWTSAPIKILYAMKNVSTVIVGHMESVVCSAISSDNCSYSWVARTHPNFETEIIKGQVLVVDRPGTFQCEAICPLRHTFCSVTSLYVEYSISTTAQTGNPLLMGLSVTFGILTPVLVFLIIFIIFKVVRERRKSKKKWKHCFINFCSSADVPQNTEIKTFIPPSHATC